MDKQKVANVRMLKRISLCLLVSAGLTAPAIADEVVANHEGLSATIVGEETCSDVLRIVIDAPDSDAFGDDRDDLTVLLKAVRTRLRFDCPKAEDVLIEGVVDDDKVYRGAFSKGTDWALVDLTRPKSSDNARDDDDDDDDGDDVEQSEAAKPIADKTQLMSLTMERCETKYQKTDFCICAMEQLTKIDLSLAEWELISRDFSNVVELSKSIQEIKKSFRACYG